MDGYGWTTWTKWLGELSICVKHKPKPPMLVNRPTCILQTLQKGLKYKPINAHMSCRSVNAIVPLILMSMSQASTLSPTSPPFTPLGSPQMGTWWWSLQTKLGMRMPGITLVNAPWHQAHVRVKPHENSLIFCLCHLLSLAARFLPGWRLLPRQLLWPCPSSQAWQASSCQEAFHEN